MDNLLFLAGEYHKMSTIPVSVLNVSGSTFIYERGYTYDSNPLRYGDVLSRIIRKSETRDIPFIISDDGICAYGGMKDISSCIIVFGPVELQQLSKSDVQKYARSRGIPLNEFIVVPRSIRELTAALTTMYFLRFGKEVSEKELFDDSNDTGIHSMEMFDMVNYIMQNTEDNVRRMSYDSEIAYLDTIRNGDIESIINNRQDVDLSGDVNLVARLADRPTKHFEYMVCSSITLATRAAIDGGVEPNVAYLLSELYMRRLEQCSDSISSIISLHIEMTADFTKHVRTAKDQRKRISYVEKCKMYIVEHLNKPFNIDELTKELNINKAYLSKKFKEEIGMSIMEYTRTQRIEAATGMLKYSDKSITTIATFLCFASQSHFGAMFKKVKGITPQQYRSENQVCLTRGGD